MARRRAWWFVVLQVLLAVGVGYYVWRALRANWDQLATVGSSLTFRAGPVLGSAGVVLATYGLLIEGWRRVVDALGQRLRWRDATRIWTLSNLGRYLPGKVWAIVGLAALAQAAGVSGWAATAAALAMQVLSVGTGAGMAAAAAPDAVNPAWLAVALGLVALTVAALASPPLVRRLSRAAAGPLTSGFAVPRRGPLLLATAVTLGAWAGYGFALWLLARGVLATPHGLTPWRAAGAFAASYVVGLLAVFAPGGVGVREGMLFGLLQPTLGAADAFALAVASRVLLTGTELAAAGLGWMVGPGKDGNHR